MTCAARTIDDPLRAAKDIDEVIRAIWLNQQPGYLEIHRDMVEKETRLRPLILTGDGGFQMTGAEIAHARRYGLNPIVILLNNGGWGIFRPIAKRHDLLALPSWHYAELARLWGGQGYKVETAAELRGALEKAAGSDDFAIIEVSIGPRDLSPITLKYIRASAKKAQMNSRSEFCHE